MAAKEEDVAAVDVKQSQVNPTPSAGVPKASTSEYTALSTSVGLVKSA